ncbi:MAG TPA: sigma 54-interacting transcriptional regulator, partial [Candidatus Binatus sp.]|nr:sigma 54-interacting transcriptional regulator [Candidatus Binatus sp.]
MQFLEIGLRATDYGVIFGHDEANRAVCRILEERGLDLPKLIAAGRFTVLGGASDSEILLGEIDETLQRIIARGSALVRLLGNIGWGRPNWPAEADLLAFESQLTETVKKFACVMVCMYDVGALPGTVVRHGGFGCHPQVVRDGAALDNPHFVPREMFLHQLDGVAGSVAERRCAEDTLHHITEGVATATGEEFFRSLARHLADALQARYSFITECADDAHTRVRALAFWDGSGFATDVEYSLRGTPCEKVIEGNVCSYPDRLQVLFPEDKPLVTLGAESFVGVPLPGAAGQVLGHLVVMDNKPRVFGAAELRILRIFATRAGAELQRIRADREVQLRNLELGMLLDINRAIGRHLERDPLFGALAGCLRALVTTDRFGIELPIAGDKLQGHILSAFPSSGGPTEPTVLPGAGTACHWVSQNREWYVAGCRDEFRERFPVTFEVMTAQGMESLCALPLISGEVSHGALFFMAAERDAYRLLRREFMEQVANQIAIAINNVKSYEKIAALNATVAATARRRQTLLEINNAIVTKLTRDDLLSSVGAALVRVVEFDRLALSLYDAATKVLRIVSHSGPYERTDYTPVGRVLELNDSPAGEAFLRQRAVVRSDLDTTRQTASEERAYGHGFRSLCSIPLVARGKSIGAFTIGSLTRGRYTESDVEFLTEVANQIAIAIDNMTAHEETEALKARFQAEAVYLQEEIRTEHNFQEIIGQSASVRALLRKLEQVAPTDATVLIRGETGTGKELLARAVHDRSRRQDRPLVKVNCGSIPSGLVESELFGHEKGAFTGATQRRIGRFELAHGGTIFLDEVTELPLDTQVKLLRVLQEGEFERVGSSQTMKVDVRVIAATNRDLGEIVSQGIFRSDLFYRLNVFPLDSPALRERQEDIPLLVSFFLSRFAKRLGKEIRGVAQKSMASLIDYSWPGNIRELQNVI